MGKEIEAKFKVSSFSAVRRALRATGAKFISTAIQTDCFFDGSDRVFLKRDIAIRLREVKLLKRAAGVDTDERCIITFKGPADRGRFAKTRQEIQTTIDDPKAMYEILTACGLKPMLIVRKKRSSYRLDGGFIELDELPLVGRFVEIEAASSAKIELIRRRLGLPKEAVTESYVSLLSKHCGEVGDKCRKIVFENCKKCKKRSRR